MPITEHIEKVKEVFENNHELFSEINKNNASAILQIQEILLETWKRNIEIGSEIHKAFKEPLEKATSEFTASFKSKS